MRKLFILLIILFLIQAFIFSYFQFLDADEGHYLNSGRLLFSYGLPYRDYFANAFPGLILVIHLFYLAFGNSIELIRFGLASISIIPLLLIFKFLFSYFKDKLTYQEKIFLVLTSFIFLTQNLNYQVHIAQVKHYAISMPLSILCTVYAFKIIQGKNIKDLQLLTFLTFLSITTRHFLLIPQSIVFVYCIFLFTANMKNKIYVLKKLILPFILGLLPILLGIISFNDFLFSNYFAINKYFKLASLSFSTKLKMALSLHFSSIQYTILSCFFTLSIVLVFWGNFKKSNKDLKFLNCIFFTIHLPAILFAIFYLIASPIFSFIHWNYINYYLILNAIMTTAYLSTIKLKYLKIILISIMVIYIYPFQFKSILFPIQNNPEDPCKYTYLLRFQSPFSLISQDHRKYNNKNCYRSLNGIYSAAKIAQKEYQNSIKVNKYEEGVLSWLTSITFISNLPPAKGFEVGVAMNELFLRYDIPNSIASSKGFLNLSTIKENIEKQKYPLIITDPYTEWYLHDLIKNNYILKSESNQYQIWAP